MSSLDLNATAASLLGFLHKGPMTGWDLVCGVEASVGYFWNVTRSQVYRELKTLAASGLAVAKTTGARESVPYAITALGRSAFAEWIARAPGPEILRLPIVLTVFFGRHIEPSLLTRFLEKARLDHLTRLDEYERIWPEIEDPFQRSALDLGLAYEKTVIAWLEAQLAARRHAPDAGRSPSPRRSPAASGSVRGAKSARRGAR